MRYIKPIIKISEAEAATMLADSLKISDETVSGENALTKEDNDWNIWDEE